MLADAVPPESARQAAPAVVAEPVDAPKDAHASASALARDAAPMENAHQAAPAAEKSASARRTALADASAQETDVAPLESAALATSAAPSPASVHPSAPARLLLEGLAQTTCSSLVPQSCLLPPLVPLGSS